MTEIPDPQFEAELATSFERLRLPTILPRPVYTETRAPRLGRKPLAGFAAVPALLTTKAFAAAAVVTLAGTAVGVKAVVTGNGNPVNWGQQVSEQVDKCKTALSAGQHGIGPCVSAFANQHGKQVSAAHSQAGAHGDAKSHATGAPTGSGNAGHHGKPSSPPDESPDPGLSGGHPAH